MTRDYFIKNCVPSHEERVAECDPDAIVPEQQLDFVPKMLNGSQAKTAFALRENAERMIREDGIESIGFMTLTVGDWIYEHGEKRFRQVFDSAEANRRINNVGKLLRELFERFIIVTERHAKGAVHFHILGTLAGRPDIRTGFDWKRFEKGDYRHVSERLRRIWAVLRERLPEYGFGRAETTPIRTCSGALSRYIAKYIEKNVTNRQPEDKRKKLVRYWGWDGSQLKPNNFGWAGERACAWRAKTRQLAGIVGIREPEQAAEFFGPRWAFHLSETWGRLFGRKDLYPGLILSPAEYIKAKEVLTQKREWRWRTQVEKSEIPKNQDWFLELMDDPKFVEWLEGNYGNHNSNRNSEAVAA